MSGSVSRSNQVCNSFSLAEIHFAVEICTLGIFTGLSHRTAMLKKKFDDTLQDVGRTVTRYLSGVFTGVGVWSTIYGNEDLVYESAIGVANLTEVHGVWLYFG